MPRQFLYTGYAAGFSASITAPFKEVVEAQAPCSLGVTGGYTRARVENFRHRELFSFASAHTQASGILSEKSRAFETLMSGELEGLNILDMVKAEHIVGRLSSKHPEDPPEQGPDEPTVSPVGSHYGKVVVGGYVLTPVIDVNVFNRVCSYTELCTEIGSDSGLRARFNIPEEAELPPKRGLLIGSIVSEIRGGGPGLEISGHTVHVRGFGTLYFGEFLISPYSRRLVMLRASLGCPVQMDCSGPDMGGNGHAP